MRQLQDWITLIDQNAPIVALEYQTPDRMAVVSQFYRWGEVRSLPVYIWNPTTIDYSLSRVASG